MTEKDNKKAHISNTLAGGEIQALQSANADQHRDRITRFGILKHRGETTRKLFVDSSKIQRKLSSRLA